MISGVYLILGNYRCKKYLVTSSGSARMKKALACTFSYDYLGGAPAAGHNIVEPAALYCAWPANLQYAGVQLLWGMGGGEVL
jgi:hypothetical protein